MTILYLFIKDIDEVSLFDIYKVLVKLNRNTK